MLPRFIVIAAVVVLLALAAPALAPGLLAPFKPQAEVAAVEPASAHKATIAADSNGHFATEAVIDGRTVPVVIDTGATTVVLTGATARRLAIAPAAADYTVSIQTANGIVPAARVTIGTVTLGNVTVHDVAAVVIGSDKLELNLVGMSFLNRLTKFEAGGGQLVLVE